MSLLFARLFPAFVFIGLLNPLPLRAKPGAPTVTLWYQSSEAVVFYNEVNVLRSAPSSYFCACGWQSGYFGIQELRTGKKVIIFSVWDSDDDNPAALPENQRVKAVEVGEGVRIGRFGNEGSGGQSFLDYPWQNGVSYSFLVTAEKKKKRVEYSAFFRAPGMEHWTFIATFSTHYSPLQLTGLYSFVEDFERSPASEKRTRQALFSNGWVQVEEGPLKALNRAQFVADRPTQAVDALLAPHGFQVAIGGKITNQSQPLDSFLSWQQKPGPTPPPYFPK